MIAFPTPATITAVYEENYRTKTFVLDTNLSGYPGQFVMLWLPRFDEKPFSLVNDNPVTLMITAVGPFSRLVHTKEVGERLWLRGPFGQGYHVPATEQRLALVGGGYGVAPLYWLARTQIARAATIDVIIGARTAAEILFAERFQRLQQEYTNLTLHLTTEDGSVGQRGRVTAALQPLLATHSVDGLYACGPHGMLAALERLAQDAQLPCQLSWEAYMRCGIGICGACEHEGKVLCLDGPVLVSG
ncbi:MAG: hypothetical protein R3C14_25420 [Caldilineaceae bacterium]